MSPAFLILKLAKKPLRNSVLFLWRECRHLLYCCVERSAHITNYMRVESALQPSEGTVGDSGRNILRGDGLNNVDFSLFKNARITERVTAQIRAESFNLLNHTQFGPFPGDSFSLDPQSQFGVYRGTLQEARIIQLGLKFIF